MKQYTLIIVLLIILAGAVAAWVVVDKQAKKKDKDQQPTDISQSTATTPTTSNNPVATVKPVTTTTSDYPITYNKKSEAAKALQKALGFTGSNVDGVIGKNSLTAWQKYKVVNADFTIRNVTELNYYIYEINEKKAGRTPIAMATYMAAGVSLSSLGMSVR